MSEAYQLAREVCEKQLSVSLVPKTVDELERLIAKRPDHPASLALERAIQPYHGYDVVVRVSPISVQAIEQNRDVVVEYTMTPIVSPSGKTVYKKTKTLVLDKARPVGKEKTEK